MPARHFAFDSRTRTMSSFGSSLPPFPIVYTSSSLHQLPGPMSTPNGRNLESDEDYILNGTAFSFDHNELTGSQPFAGELLYPSSSFGNWDKSNATSPSAQFKQSFSLNQVTPSNSRYLESSTRFDDTPSAFGQQQSHAQDYMDLAPPPAFNHSRNSSYDDGFATGMRLGHQRELSSSEGGIVPSEFFPQHAFVQPADVAELQYGSPSMGGQMPLPETNSVPFPSASDSPSPFGYDSSPGLTSDKDDSMSEATGDDEDGEYDPADSDYGASGTAKSKRTRRSSATSIMSMRSEGSQATPRRRRATRAPAPVPIANLTKKSRGRRVPTSPIHVQDGGISKAARPHVCPAEDCQKRFSRNEHLKRHVRSIHTEEKRKFSAAALSLLFIFTHRSV